VIGVAFGLSGTLGSDNGLYRAAIEHLIAGLYCERSEEPNGRVISAILKELPPGQRRPSADVLSLVAELFPEATVKASIEDRLRSIARDLVKRYFQPFPDALTTIKLLDEMQVPHAILGDDRRAVELSKAEMLGVSRKLVAMQDAEWSPDGRSLEAFATLAKTLQLPSDLIFFVGRDPHRDIAPAHAAGFRTVWLNRSTRSFPRGIPRPDHTIARLDAIFRVISRPYTRAAMYLSEWLHARM
jgi:FMN phosphatase YigB (HAD superfamily)